MTRTVRTTNDAAFVRGFCVAAALEARQPIQMKALLRAGGITEQVMKDAGVDEFDAVELRPFLEKRVTRWESATSKKRKAKR